MFVLRNRIQCFYEVWKDRLWVCGLLMVRDNVIGLIQDIKRQAEEQGCVAMRYVDNDGNLATDYPYNPNGSEDGIAALCSLNGHHLSLMPHP